MSAPPRRARGKGPARPARASVPAPEKAPEKAPERETVTEIAEVEAKVDNVLSKEDSLLQKKMIQN